MKKRRLAVLAVLAGLGGSLPFTVGLHGGDPGSDAPPEAAALAPAAEATAASPAGWKLIGWNDLGMHCTDGSDFSVFAVLPPFNTFHAHLINPSGDKVENPSGITVTYEAVADPAGSINKTSAGKTNFWQYVKPLFGVSLAPDAGLAGFRMPGSNNTPRTMRFDAAASLFTAEGVPITPYDDSGRKNYYPMMRLTARDRSGTILARTHIVIPVSDEMDCRACHASGSGAAARPSAGWVYVADPARDVKLNVLRLHDDRNLSNSVYQKALSAAGFNRNGLYATVTVNKTPILCGKCHGSNALPGTGMTGIPMLTQALHKRHAGVIDPANGLNMNDSGNRSSCYRCHPGSSTKCLRGAMGKAVAPDGTLAMQCQDCHGSMTAVANPSRKGWLDQPVCQSCHTGTAVQNNGQIRYASVFESSGQVRNAVNLTFATKPDSPGPGLSLYRFSTGHGGLQCEACHGSPHAIYPTSHLNDNIQNNALQGHEGTLVECAACHGTQPETVSGGPHGMHPVGALWLDRHKDPGEHNPAQCQACHGADYRGTELSRSHADRILSTKFGTKNFWRGFQIGCYACHNGPRDDGGNPNRAPVVSNASAVTTAAKPVLITLAASDADGNPLTLRIVSQAAHGTVGLQGRQATYYPESGYLGTDSFSFAAWDGMTDSNLGRVTLTVGP